jgi:hypothetical protein
MRGPVSVIGTQTSPPRRSVSGPRHAERIISPRQESATVTAGVGYAILADAAGVLSANLEDPPRVGSLLICICLSRLYTEPELPKPTRL